MFKVDNMPYFLMGYTVLIVVLVIFVIIRQYKFERSFAHGKVKIISRIEIDAITGEETVVMSIINRSFNSVEIRGFGYKHYNQDYDYMKNYRLENDIKASDKIYVAARETLEVRIDIDNLKTKLNSKNIKKFRAYAIDVYGNYVLASAKYVEKYIELFFSKVEFVEKVNNMEPSKKQKYLLKQGKLDKRATEIVNKSIVTKLKFVDETINMPEVQEEVAIDEVELSVKKFGPMEEIFEENVERETIEEEIVEEAIEETPEVVVEAVGDVQEELEETEEDNERNE